MSKINRLLNRLNPEQYQAATSSNPRILVIAGAGSGKTSVLTTRIAHLQLNHRVGTSNMLALTFTRLAAKEMKQRVAKILGDSLAKKLTAGTFHAFCVKVLKQYGKFVGMVDNDFSVYGEEDKQDLLTGIVEDLNLGKKVNINNLDVWGNNSTALEQQVINEYHYRLRKNHAVDLDGLLALTVKLLEKHPDIAQDLRSVYTHVFVDEYQDTDDRQERILQLLNPENLFVVGDPSQSIYSWRGAQIENILTFEERHDGCEVIRLERNYRSTKPILNLANKVIERAFNKSPLKLWTDKEGIRVGLGDFESQETEAKRVARLIETDIRSGRQMASDIAILCRTNYQVELYEKVLKESNIPVFRLSNSTALKSYDVQRVLDYMAYFCNMFDELAFKRIVNWPERRFSDVELKVLELDATKNNQLLSTSLESMQITREWNWYKDPNDKSWQGDVSTMFSRLLGFLKLRQRYDDQRLVNKLAILDNAETYIASWKQRQIESGESYDPYSFLKWLKLRDVQERLELEQPKGVQIMTVHGSKGLEFPCVYVPGCNQDIFPSRKGDLEEERRLFYVAVTRAKTKLVLTYAYGRTNAYNGKFEGLHPSPFLDVMEASA